MKTVSDPALFARIQRALRRQDGDEAIRRCRENSRWSHELGRYYIVDANRNWILDRHVDLEELGRELGVLAADEFLVE